MLILPIRTEVPVRTPARANHVLIALNVAIWLTLHVLMGKQGQALVLRGMLHAAEPRLWEFLTYQFLHADFSHIAGNMLFLYIFGNAVNSKMGNLVYLLFYLAGGIFAGMIFAQFSPEGDVLGASGAIAAVTTAYLVLYPRSHVTVFYWFFLFGVFQIPSMILITLKIILWDNILEPGLFGGPGYVAYSAHLGGYLFGFAVPMLMLAIGALPRDQFDLMALWARFRRRQQMAEAYGTPQGRAQARYGRVARPVASPDLGGKTEAVETDTPVNKAVSDLRGRISEALSRRDMATAARLYGELIEQDGEQILPQAQQVDVANQLMSEGQHRAAATAYERALRTYKNLADREQLYLLLGILYGRYLNEPAKAAENLRAALPGLVDTNQRSLCNDLLARIAAGADGGTAEPAV